MNRFNLKNSQETITKLFSRRLKKKVSNLIHHAEVRECTSSLQIFENHYSLVVEVAMYFHFIVLTFK